MIGIEEVISVIQDYKSGGSTDDELYKILYQFFDERFEARKEEFLGDGGFTEMEMNQVRGQFVFLIKYHGGEVDSKTLISLMQEAIKRIKASSEDIKLREEIEAFKEEYKDKIEFLIMPMAQIYQDFYASYEMKDDHQKIWNEIEEDKEKFDKESEQPAYGELAKIIHYIKAKRQNLCWAYMLNHPDSELWSLVGNLGVKNFERLFMEKLREGGKKLEFPDIKKILTEGRQFLAKWLHHKFPKLSLKAMAKIINQHYTVEKGEFVNERKLKYWLYEKEGEIVESLEDYDDLTAKVFNGIKRRIFDEMFQDYLMKRRDAHKKKKKLRKTKTFGVGRRSVGKA